MVVSSWNKEEEVTRLKNLWAGTMQGYIRLQVRLPYREKIYIYLILNEIEKKSEPSDLRLANGGGEGIKERCGVERGEGGHTC